MNELAPGNHIVMTPSEDGSGRGAAIVAAVASRLRDAGEYKWPQPQTAARHQQQILTSV